MPEVELYLDTNQQPTEEIKVMPAGLVLWDNINDIELEMHDRTSIRCGEGMSELQQVQFEFQQTLEWDDWQHVCLPRLRYAAALKIPHLPQLEPHDGKMAVVGAGPSVTQYLDKIKPFKESEFDNLMSVNGTHDWLIKNGITPRIHVIAEMDLEDVTLALGGQPNKDVVYYIASYCHQNIFEQLEGYKRVLWHSFIPPQGYQQAIASFFPHEFMIAGGFATFFRSMSIAITLGFRHFDLFGLDSSFDESSHMDGYSIADREPKITVWGAGPYGVNLKKFKTQGGLAFQAKEFLEFCKYNQAGLRLCVHGDGLLRHLHENHYPEQYQE